MRRAHQATVHVAWLQVRRDAAELEKRPHHQRRHTPTSLSPVYQLRWNILVPCGLCTTAAKDWESFQRASPHSTPSSLHVYTSNISTPEKNSPLQSQVGLSPSEECSGSEMWEDEKSQPAVKPKSNSWVWNRGEHLSAVDSLFSAQIKSWCQHEHEQEIAPLVEGEKCRMWLIFLQDREKKKKLCPKRPTLTSVWSLLFFNIKLSHTGLDTHSHVEL